MNQLPFWMTSQHLKAPIWVLFILPMVALLLIHWPVSGMDLKACLDTMFKLRDRNKVKYVGVSNFDPDLFKEALGIGDILTNQVKYSPHTVQDENLKIARDNNCIITAYSPLERGSKVKDKSAVMYSFSTKVTDLLDQFTDKNIVRETIIEE